MEQLTLRFSSFCSKLSDEAFLKASQESYLILPTGTLPYLTWDRDQEKLIPSSTLTPLSRQDVPSECHGAKRECDSLQLHGQSEFQRRDCSLAPTGAHEERPVDVLDLMSPVPCDGPSFAVTVIGYLWLVASNHRSREVALFRTFTKPRWPGAPGDDHINLHTAGLVAGPVDTEVEQ